MKHAVTCASTIPMYDGQGFYRCDCGAERARASMTGEEIHRGMCHSFDKDGKTVEPLFKYVDLTLAEKVIYLEWRDSTLCDEFSEECREFARVIGPMRPHNDLRFRRNENGEIVCPTFYDGCNCDPDHTQADYNDLKAENKRLREILEMEGYKIDDNQMRGR